MSRWRWTRWPSGTPPRATTSSGATSNASSRWSFDGLRMIGRHERVWMIRDGDCSIIGRKDHIRTEMWRFLRTMPSKPLQGRLESSVSDRRKSRPAWLEDEPNISLISEMAYKRVGFRIPPSWPSGARPVPGLCQAGGRHPGLHGDGSLRVANRKPWPAGNSLDPGDPQGRAFLHTTLLESAVKPVFSEAWTAENRISNRIFHTPQNMVESGG